MPVYSAEGAPLFSEGSGGSLRLIAYLALAAALMAADQRSGLLHGFRRQLATLAEPVHQMATAPLRVLRAAREATVDRERLVHDNRELREQLLFAQAKLARLDVLSEQNERLRALLDARRKLGLNARLAEVVEVDLDPFRHRIRIQPGADEGVFVGQAVIDATGLIGQVLEVEPQSATVLLISDPSHAVPVRVVRTGLRVIAYGVGSTQRVELPHVPFSADIRPGDVLVSSGIGGRFPPGLPVATVTEVRNDRSASFAVAEAAPMAGIHQSGELLLVNDESLKLAPIEPEAELMGPPQGLLPPASVAAPDPALPAPEAVDPVAAELAPAQAGAGQ